MGKMDLQEYEIHSHNRGMGWEMHAMDWDNCENVLPPSLEAVSVTSAPEHLLVFPFSLEMPIFELTLNFKGIRNG